MISKIISPLKTKIRTFSTLSSDVVLKDEHLETYYRGNLLKINYSEVRDNPSCQEVYYQDNIFQEEDKPGPEAVPELVMRKNDMLNFDWNDGTWSSVNLTKLIENKFSDELEDGAPIEGIEIDLGHPPEDNLDNEDDLKNYMNELIEFEDSELDKTLTELSETGVTKTNLGLKTTLSKIAFFPEATHYCQTHKSVHEALPSDHNGLAIIATNKDLKIQLINTIKFSESFRNRHPKYFKKLATQPSLVYAKSYPSPGWLKCITMDDESGEVEEIRMGSVDKVMVGDYTQQAYDCFEYEMQNYEESSDEGDKLDENSESDDESYVDEVILTPGNTVLIDCTTWRLKVNDEEADSDLKVRSCLLTNDNWKSTARMLKSSN